jgi:phosphoglycolate phosphatase-like HAD superfamily hydrolase
MNSILGPAPILDFDGTLARLGVPWEEVRATLGVARIHDLWNEHEPRKWAIVNQAEQEAADVADIIPEVQDALEPTVSFAILTSNSETSVWRFLDRFNQLRSRVQLVVGRETLAGPKSEFPIFARGFRACVEATAHARHDSDMVYVGDMSYELAFARRLGARPIHVDELQGGR